LEDAVTEYQAYRAKEAAYLETCRAAWEKRWLEMAAICVGLAEKAAEKRRTR
jgi:hypothetical protein